DRVGDFFLHDVRTPLANGPHAAGIAGIADLLADPLTQIPADGPGVLFLNGVPDGPMSGPLFGVRDHHGVRLLDIFHHLAGDLTGAGPLFGVRHHHRVGLLALLVHGVVDRAGPGPLLDAGDHHRVFLRPIFPDRVVDSAGAGARFGV